MSYPDPNRTATEIRFDRPRWLTWLKARAGFLILCGITVGLYLYFENKIELAWWGVVVAYLIFVILLLAGAKFIHKCDEDIRRMK